MSTELGFCIKHKRLIADGCELCSLRCNICGEVLDNEEEFIEHRELHFL